MGTNSTLIVTLVCSLALIGFAAAILFVIQLADEIQRRKRQRELARMTAKLRVRRLPYDLQ